MRRIIQVREDAGFTYDEDSHNGLPVLQTGVDADGFPTVDLWIDPTTRPLGVLLSGEDGELRVVQKGTALCRKDTGAGLDAGDRLSCVAAGATDEEKALLEAAVSTDYSLGHVELQAGATEDRVQVFVDISDNPLA